MNPNTGTLPHTVRPRQWMIVGIGELGVSRDPSTILSTYGLGSCVGVAAYDPVTRAGGLIHIMLPNSAIEHAKAAEQPALFANTGLPLFLAELLKLPAERSRLRFLVAGGAGMLCAAHDFNLGSTNTRVTFEILGQQSLPVSFRAIGGTANRTLHFDIATGTVTLKADTEKMLFSLAA